MFRDPDQHLVELISPDVGKLYLRNRDVNERLVTMRTVLHRS